MTTNATRYNNDWGDEVKIANRYEGLRAKLLELLEEFVNMLDRYLRHVATARNRIELAENNVCVV